MTVETTQRGQRTDVAPTDLARVAWAVNSLEVETPSWGYGNSGTRFKVFPQPGVPRDPFEKVEDAATVRRFTCVARSIALHIPWDRVDDYAMLANVFPEEVAHAVLFFASARSAKSTGNIINVDGGVAAAYAR